jgi:hypothetical protein
MSYKVVWDMIIDMIREKTRSEKGRIRRSCSEHEEEQEMNERVGPCPVILFILFTHIPN